LRKGRARHDGGSDGEAQTMGWLVIVRDGAGEGREGTAMNRHERRRQAKEDGAIMHLTPQGKARLKKSAAVLLAIRCIERAPLAALPHDFSRSPVTVRVTMGRNGSARKTGS
jgi:hypothetical protein